MKNAKYDFFLKTHTLIIRKILWLPLCDSKSVNHYNDNVYFGSLTL